MNQRLKRVKTLLKRAEQKGLNIDKITEGRSLETLSRNAKSLANFEKRYERQKQLPKLKEEVKQIDKKIEDRKRLREIEKIREINRNRITKETKNELKWNQGLDPNTIRRKKLKDKTSEYISDFFETYFKQISLESDAQKKIRKLSKRFGVRLDLAYQFIDYISDMSFKYELPREVMKTETPSDFAEMLRDRLDEFERILGREFNI